MKKRSLSMILCFCMVIGLLPISAMANAAPAGVKIGGVLVKGSEWYAITDESGNVTTDNADQDNWNIRVLTNITSDAAITLKNAIIKNENGDSGNIHAIFADCDLSIDLQGAKNQIGTDESCEWSNGIYNAGSSVTITGEGDLVLKGHTGIYTQDGDVSIDISGSLSIDSDYQIARARENLIFTAKSIDTTGGHLWANGVNLTARDGNISIQQTKGTSDDAITAGGSDRGNVAIAAPNGEISITGKQYAINTTYPVSISAQNDITLTGTVEGSGVSLVSESGDVTVNRHYGAIKTTKEGVIITAPKGNVTLASKESFSAEDGIIVAGKEGYSLNITAGGVLDIEGPTGIMDYNEAVIKADSVRMVLTNEGFSGRSLKITNPSGGNCKEVFVSGGGVKRDVISATDLTIKADQVVILANEEAENAIEATNATVGDVGVMIGKISIKEGGNNNISPSVVYADKNGGDASSGLDLTTETPTVDTYYKAGDGYVLWKGSSYDSDKEIPTGTLILHNATIYNKTSRNDGIGPEHMGIAPPSGNITTVLEGINNITSEKGHGIGYDGFSIILSGDGELTVAGPLSGIMLMGGLLEFADSGKAILNGVVGENRNGKPTSTVYGNVTVGEDESRLYGDTVIGQGTVLTIPKGKILWLDKTDSVTNEGTIINKGKIILPYTYTVKQIQALNLNGTVELYDENTQNRKIYVEGELYVHGGKLENGLYLAESTPTEATCYQTEDGYIIFTPELGDAATLILHDANLEGNLELATQSTVIHTTGKSTIKGTIANTNTKAANLTFTGSQPLTILGYRGHFGEIGKGPNYDTISVQGGAKVTINESIFLGGSESKEDASLNVTGKGSTLSVNSSEDYGIYIDGGKLYVDDTSKLMINSPVAAFCVVDHESTKTQGQAVTLPGMPAGTKIGSVKGKEKMNGSHRTYWSHLPTGGSLTVSNEDKTPVTLTGTARGDFTFAKAKSEGSGDSGDSSGGSSGGGSSSNSGGATTTTPSKTEPNAPTKVSTSVDSTVSNGTASVTISQSTVADAIGKAQAEAKKSGMEKNGISVEIKLETKNTKVSNLSANLPKATVGELAKVGVKELHIKSDLGIITLDLETLKKIQKEINSDVIVSAKRVDNKTLSAEVKAIVGDRPVYDFSITGANGEKVTSFGKGKISISIPYTLGKDEKSENIVAYYIDDSGKIYEMPDSVYDKKTEMLSFTTDHFSKFAVGYKEDEVAEETDQETEITPDDKAAVGTIFTDIASHWAKKDIEFVTARGLFGGTAEGIFSPNMSMTRGMLVTVLGRLDKADLSSYRASSFTDVKSDTYYMPAIEWARESGIVNGLSPREFGPNQPITREQLAVIMANYASLIDLELEQIKVENTFGDDRQISSYAKSAVKDMQIAGIISGKADNKFDPKGTATRAEVSSVLKRFIDMFPSTENTKK